MEYFDERSDAAVGLEALEGFRARADDEGQLKAAAQMFEFGIIMSLVAAEVSKEGLPTR
jgi:hypothetical protein